MFGRQGADDFGAFEWRLPQQGLGVAHGKPAAEIIALRLIATAGDQKSQLLRRLDAFGHHVAIHCMPQADDGIHDRGIVIGDRQVMDETSIDLERANGKALQITEARIAGAEIVNR